MEGAHDVLDLLVLPPAIVSMTYISYIITKNYQTKRTIQLSRALGLNPESSSLFYSLLNTLPRLASIMTARADQIHEEFAEVTDAMIVLMSLVLGVLIYLSSGPPSTINYLLFTKCIIFSMAAYFSLFFLFVHDGTSVPNIIFSTMMLAIFTYLSVSRNFTQFRENNSIYVYIDDYSTRLSRTFGYIELLLTKVFSVFCGQTPIFHDKDEGTISRLSPSLLLACFFVVYNFQMQAGYLVLCAAVCVLLGVILNFATKRGKGRTFMAAYSLLSSTYMLFLLSRVLRLLGGRLGSTFGIRDLHVCTTLQSLLSDVAVLVATFAFFNENQVEMAYQIATNAYVPVVLLGIGSSAASGPSMATNSQSMCQQARRASRHPSYTFQYSTS